MSTGRGPDGSDEELGLLQRRLARERRARLEAESIAERVTAELYDTVRALEQANLVLERANEAVRDFVAIAAHDLRGPLATIMGFTSLLATGWERESEDQKRQFVAIIERQSDYLHRMVEDLMTVSRIEAGAMDAHIEEIFVARSLQQIVDEFAGHPAQIGVVCPEDLTVRVDPDHLHRIVVNYLANALNYGEPPVQASACDAGDWVELRVSDHGPGVPEEFIPRLFSKFARADAAANRKAKGTGLGLSIVRGLAVINGGDAWYEPNHPQGSCFAVKLPKRAA